MKIFILICLASCAFASPVSQLPPGPESVSPDPSKVPVEEKSGRSVVPRNHSGESGRDETEAQKEMEEAVQKEVAEAQEEAAEAQREAYEAQSQVSKGGYAKDDKKKKFQQAVPTRFGRKYDENELAKSSVSATEEILMRKLNSKCAEKDVSSCVMLKMVTYMNRLLKKSNLELSDTVEITQTSPAVVEEIKVDESRGFSDESTFGKIISEKLWSFVKSRSLKLKVLPETDVVFSTNPDAEGNLNLGVSLKDASASETGRKKQDMSPFIAAGIMKIGMLKILAFKALALLVGKALLVSKLAFLLAAAIGLKKLLHHEKHVTYEVVSHPHHSSRSVESHPESSEWERSADAAQQMAYKAHLN